MTSKGGSSSQSTSDIFEAVVRGEITPEQGADLLMPRKSRARQLADWIPVLLAVAALLWWAAA